MSNFIEEIKAEVAQERWHNLWKQYRQYVLGAANAIVLLTGGHVWWQNHQKAVIAAQSNAYIQAAVLSETNTEAALKIFERIPSKGNTVYATMARFWVANILAEQGDNKGAISLYKIIENNNGGIFASAKQKSFAKAALFRRLYMEVDDAAEHVLSTVQAYTKEDNPWRHLAYELAALALIKLNRSAEAKPYLEKLVNDQDIAYNIKMRHQLLLNYVNAAE